MDQWYLDNLVCPITHESLEYIEGFLVTKSKTKYPVIDGVPIMLLGGEEQTIGIAQKSLDITNDLNSPYQSTDKYYLETVCVSEKEREAITNALKIIHNFLIILSSIYYLFLNVAFSKKR